MPLEQARGVGRKSMGVVRVCRYRTHRQFRARKRVLDCRSRSTVLSKQKVCPLSFFRGRLRLAFFFPLHRAFSLFFPKRSRNSRRSFSCLPRARSSDRLYSRDHVEQGLRARDSESDETARKEREREHPRGSRSHRPPRRNGPSSSTK